MQIKITKAGRVHVKVSKFTYKHQLSLGDILTLTILMSWFLFDVFKGITH
jgi:hypothetical protein